MHIPKNYFHNRLVLALLTANAFLVVLTGLLVTYRLRISGSNGYTGQYHSNLQELSQFEEGTATTIVAFVVFSVFVFILHTMISMRMYHRRREFSIAILWLGLLLLVLALVVSNALLSLQ